MKLIIIGPVVAVLSALGAITDHRGPRPSPTRVDPAPFEAAAFDPLIRGVTGRMKARDLEIGSFSRKAVRPRHTYRHEYVRPPQDTQYVHFRVYRVDNIRGTERERHVADGRVDRRSRGVEMSRVARRNEPRTFVSADDFIAQLPGLRAR